MDFRDKLIHCSICGSAFIFSAEKQEFCKVWGLPAESKQCSSCRKTVKSKQGISSGNFGTTNRRLYQAICSDCGKTTNLPFEPRSGRKVYCGDCYRKVRQYR